MCRAFFVEHHLVLSQIFLDKAEVHALLNVGEMKTNQHTHTYTPAQNSWPYQGHDLYRIIEVKLKIIMNRKYTLRNY